MDPSIVPGARRRPFAKRTASSHREMDAIAIPPEVVAHRIALAARRESREGSAASQMRTWVSRSISASAPSRKREPREPRCHL